MLVQPCECSPDIWLCHHDVPLSTCQSHSNKHPSHLLSHNSALMSRLPSACCSRRYSAFCLGKSSVSCSISRHFQPSFLGSNPSPQKHQQLQHKKLHMLMGCEEGE